MLSLACSTLPVLAEEGPAQAPGAEGPITERVSVLYATVRDRTGSKSLEEFYGGARDRLRTGVCAMAFTPIPSLQGIADSFSFYIPNQWERIEAISEFSEQQFWDEIAAGRVRDGGNVVVYVHGYNISFEKSCRNAALFQRALGLQDRLVLFSWPADGNVLNYTLDEADLEWSVGPLEYGLKELVERLGPGQADVVAHSLGARGVVRALSRIGCGGVSGPLLDELVLMAPDIDTAIFQQELPTLRPLAKRITLYASENDRALWLSHEVHGYPRLGEAGEQLMLMEGVETIDVSAVGLQRISGHLYHLFNPAVTADLERLLHTGNPAGERPGLEAAQLDGKPYWRMLPADAKE